MVGAVAVNAYEAATAEVIARVRDTGPVVDCATEFDCPLVPPGPTARRRTWYVTPSPRPVITSGLAVDAGDRLVQFAPSSSEYSMFSMAAPPPDPVVNATDSWPDPDVALVTVGAAGATAVTANDVVADVAAISWPLAATDADSEQVAADTNVTAPDAESMVQAPGVADA